TISFDGKPLAVDPIFHARLPKFDREMPHVIAAEMRFADGFVTRRELVIESVRSDIIGTELTPVLVRETSPAHPKTWEGCLARIDGRPIRTAAVEKPRALVLFVRDPDPHDAEASIVSPTRVRPGLARDTVKRMLSLDRETIGRVIWPVTQRFANED